MRRFLEKIIANLPVKFSSNLQRAYERNRDTAAVKSDYQFSHDLRHTCASRLIQNGMSLYEVSNILVHVNVQTTQRYAHLENVDVGSKARDVMEQVRG